MNTEQTNHEEQHLNNCRLLEATPQPSAFAEYRAWVALWKSIYKEETRRARAFRAATRVFPQAGGSGRKHPTVQMTPEILAAAGQRPTNQYDRPGRARLCEKRVAFKPLGSALWKAQRTQEAL